MNNIYADWEEREDRADWEEDQDRETFCRECPCTECPDFTLQTEFCRILGQEIRDHDIRPIDCPRFDDDFYMWCDAGAIAEEEKYYSNREI